LTRFLVAISPDLLPCRNGSFPWIGRVKYPMLSGDQGGRTRLCHQKQPARRAVARDHRGHGRTHRAQPRHRPRTRLSNRLADEPSAIDALSPREFEILRMLLAEKSVDEIASTLHISVKTAANTRYQIRAKLGVGSDIELVRLALRQRIIAADDIGR